MRRTALCIVLSLVLVACSALMDRGPVTRSITLPETPNRAYARAVSAMAQMGGALTVADPMQGLISAQVHNAVTLTVELVGVAEGTKVTVVGNLLPNKVVVGSFDEVDQYVALLR